MWIRAPLRTRGRRQGQSLVEFALVAPILLILLLAIADLGRVYTAMFTVESAAREAADYGAFNSSNWIGSAGDPDSNYAKTVTGMVDRACTASRNLMGFDGSGAGCTNPSISIRLIEPDGSAATGCDDQDRNPPCRVRVDATFNFRLIAPLGIDFMGVRLGLPDSLSFTRTSIFAISDFELDRP